MPSVSDRLKELEQELEETDRKMGIPQEPPQAQDNIHKYWLSLTADQIKKMSADDCGNGAILLQQFGFYIQNVINKQMARAYWAEENTKHVISGIISQQSGASFEERKMAAIRGNDAANSLDIIRIKSNIKIHSLSFLAQRLDGQARALLAAQQCKRGKQE